MEKALELKIMTINEIAIILTAVPLLGGMLCILIYRIKKHLKGERD